MTASLDAGDHDITAIYTNDSNFYISTSNTLTQTVQQTTITMVVASASQPMSGQCITFTAFVVGQGFYLSPQGTVTFLDGSSALGTGALDDMGTATLSTSSLLSGSHTITAVYGGDSETAGSTSDALNLAVYTAGAALTVTSAANPSVEGEAVTFTATLGGISTSVGTVTFLDGNSPLAVAPLNSNTATFTTANLDAWVHDITAIYTNDTNFLLSTSNTLTQTVQQNTMTIVFASASQPMKGQSITFTAFVDGSTDDVLGTVTFLDGSSSLAVAPLNSFGMATFSTSTLAQGSHAIRVVYGGDSNSVGSTSAILNLNVYHTGSTLTVSSAANPSVEGAAVTFTATLGGSPTGAVTFLDDGITLGTGTFASGVATFTTASLSAWDHDITALYTDDTTFSLSTSNTLTQAVQQTTVTMVVSSVDLPILRQNIIFTAFVDGSTYDALGPVTFLDGSSPLGTGALDYMSTATFSTSTLALAITRSPSFTAATAVLWAAPQPSST